MMLSGCGLLCGKLGEKQRAMIEAAQSQFSNYCVIENVPCEPYYLNIRLKQEESPELTSKLHEILYDKTDKIGWPSLHLYDNKGFFLITNHKDGKRSTVAPSW